ncbi:MAG: tetratricopeptide repeat protein [bacterium]
MTPIPQRDIKFCPGCAAPVKPGVRFCGECGFEIAELGARKAALGPTLAIVAAATLFVGGTVLLATRLRGPEASAGGAPRGPADVMRQAATQGQGVASTAAGAASQPAVAKADIEAALKPLRDAVQADASSIDARLRLGYGVYRAASLLPEYADEASTIFREILKSDPENLDATVALANVYYDLDRAADAIPLYEKFLAKNPDEASVRTDLATMYLYANRRDDAIREYQKVIAAHPDFVNAYFNLGNAYHASGDSAKALEAYRKAQDLKPPPEVAQGIENAIAKLEGRAPKNLMPPGSADGLPPGHPPLDGSAAAPVPATTATGPQGEVEALFRNHPILGSKVSQIEWDHDTQVKVWVRGFPMSQMPEAMRAVFLGKLAAGLTDIHKRAGTSEPYRAELVDVDTGEVLASAEG